MMSQLRHWKPNQLPNPTEFEKSKPTQLYAARCKKPTPERVGGTYTHIVSLFFFKVAPNNIQAHSPIWNMPNQKPTFCPELAFPFNSK